MVNRMTAFNPNYSLEKGLDSVGGVRNPTVREGGFDAGSHTVDNVTLAYARVSDHEETLSGIYHRLL